MSSFPFVSIKPYNKKQKTKNLILKLNRFFLYVSSKKENVNLWKKEREENAGKADRRLTEGVTDFVPANSYLLSVQQGNFKKIA